MGYLPEGCFNKTVGEKVRIHDGWDIWGEKKVHRYCRLVRTGRSVLTRL
jgi:hypothetical protein